MDNTDEKIRELLATSQKYQELLHRVLLDLQTGIYTPTRKGDIVLVNTKTGNTEEYHSIEQASIESGVTVNTIKAIIDTPTNFFDYQFKHKGHSIKSGIVQENNLYPSPDNGVRYDSVLVEYPNGEQQIVSSIKEASDIVGCSRQSLSYAINRDENHSTIKNGFKVVASINTVELP